MITNANLRNAKTAKNDEFYTRYEDVEKELSLYADQLRGKTVLCNCDDPERSNFYRYLKAAVAAGGPRKVIATHKTPDGSPSYAAEAWMENGALRERRTSLSGDGDFRSEECLRYLDRADVVATNPPFSLFREYISLLLARGKKFLVIGCRTAVSHRDLFPFLQNCEVGFGVNTVKCFDAPGGEKKIGNIGWFTNLDVPGGKRELVLTERYDPERYPVYDNYDAIEVRRVKDIPKDYAGKMGVPITFYDWYDPERFELIGTCGTLAGPITTADGKTRSAGGRFYLDGKLLFARLVIRNRFPEQSCRQQNKEDGA